MSLKGNDSWVLQDHLTELSLLAETAGAEVVHIITQSRNNIDPAFYIGKGKCNEIRAMAAELDIDLVIFDEDLNPGQMRNLEKAINRRIVDRTGIILDIFARRARTREAQIEVELAQLKYLLPRLTGHWRHLSRQIGGIGVRGPGETQLETDRRIVRERIAALQKKLNRIEQTRKTQRKRRTNLPIVAMVGYTNTGKSTLLNSLTESDAFVEDKLFATLDPVVRNFQDAQGRNIILTDTVGFIRKLPHHLVASFKSTLEEVVNADLILHIVDVSHPFYMEQMERVLDILQEIGAGERPILPVFNKVDLVRNDNVLSLARQRYPEGNFISALRRIGLERLVADISERLFEPPLIGKIQLEPKRAFEWERLFSDVQVVSKAFFNNMVVISFKAPRKLKDTLFEYAGSGNIQFQN